MIYVTKRNNEAVFTAYEPSSDFFVLEKLPHCPYENDEIHKLTWRCDMETKKVWYEVEYLNQPTQLDRIEGMLMDTMLETQYLASLQELGV